MNKLLRSLLTFLLFISVSGYTFQQERVLRIGNSDATPRHIDKIYNAYIAKMIVLGRAKSFNELEKFIQEIKAPKPPAKNVKLARQLNGQGLQLLQQTETLKAIETFREAYKNNHGDIEIANNLGYAYTQHPDKSMRSKAEPFLFLALQLAPNRSVAWGNLGDYLAEEYQDVELAEGCFINTIYFSQNPRNTITYFKELSKVRGKNFRVAVEAAMSKMSNF